MKPYYWGEGADSIRVVHPLFQAEEGGSIPTSALQLSIVETSSHVAKILNKKWHSRLPLFNGNASLHYAAICGGIYYAVAIWSNPVARLLPQDTWLELRRLAIAPDAPKYTASRMIAIMTKLIKAKMPHITTLISYQDTEVHAGIIYKASGWEAVARNESGVWDRPNRYRPPAQSESPKIRWQKEIAAKRCSQEVMELGV
jgi:hypothetical protein